MGRRVVVRIVRPAVCERECRRRRRTVRRAVAVGGSRCGSGGRGEAGQGAELGGGGRSLAVGGLVVRRQGGVGVVAVGMCVGGSVGGGRRRRRGQCGGGGRGGVGLLGIQNVNVATTAAVVVGVGQHRRAEVGRVHDELEAVDWGLLALLFFRLQLDSLALVANGRAVGQGWRRSKKKDQAQESG